MRELCRSRWWTRVIGGAWLSTLAFASNAYAEDSTSPVETAFSVGAGTGYYAGDMGLRLSLGFHLRKSVGAGATGTPLSLDVVLPVNLTLVDRGMPDGFWRRSEYNELSEFAGILRQLEYGEASGPVYFRLGKPSDVRIGHGTVMDRYAADLTYDHTRWGAYFSHLGAHGDLQVFADDVFSPSVLIAHGRWAPWAGREGAVRGLAFGATFAADPVRPTDARGGTTTGAAPLERAAYVKAPSDALEKFGVDRSVYPSRRPYFVGGVDLEYAFVQSEAFAGTVYGDVNVQGGSQAEIGMGGHFGAALGWQLGASTLLELQGEYIVSTEHYLPNVMGRMVELNRIDWVNRPDSADGGAGSIFDGPLDPSSRPGAHHGYRLVAGLRHERVGSLRLGWDGGDRSNDSSYFVKVSSPEAARFRLGMRYESTFQGRNFWHGALVNAEAQFALTDAWVLWADGGRRWRFEEDLHAAAHWHFMAGFSFWLGIGR